MSWKSTKRTTHVGPKIKLATGQPLPEPPEFNMAVKVHDQPDEKLAKPIRKDSCKIHKDTTKEKIEPSKYKDPFATFDLASSLPNVTEDVNNDRDSCGKFYEDLDKYEYDDYLDEREIEHLGIYDTGTFSLEQSDASFMSTWGDDVGDEHAEEMRNVVEDMENILHGGEARFIDDNDFINECLLWRSKFPHFRLIGFQPESWKDILSKPKSAEETNIEEENDYEEVFAIHGIYEERNKNKSLSYPGPAVIDEDCDMQDEYDATVEKKNDDGEACSKENIMSGAENMHKEFEIGIHGSKLHCSEQSDSQVLTLDKDSESDIYATKQECERSTNDTSPETSNISSDSSSNGSNTYCDTDVHQRSDIPCSLNEQVEEFVMESLVSYVMSELVKSRGPRFPRTPDRLLLTEEYEQVPHSSWKSDVRYPHFSEVSHEQTNISPRVPSNLKPNPVYGEDVHSNFLQASSKPLNSVPRKPSSYSKLQPSLNHDMISHVDRFSPNAKANVEQLPFAVLTLPKLGSVPSLSDAMKLVETRAYHSAADRKKSGIWDRRFSCVGTDCERFLQPLETMERFNTLSTNKIQVSAPSSPAKWTRHITLPPIERPDSSEKSPRTVQDNTASALKWKEADSKQHLHTAGRWRKGSLSPIDVPNLRFSRLQLAKQIVENAELKGVWRPSDASIEEVQETKVTKNKKKQKNRKKK